MMVKKWTLLKSSFRANGSVIFQTLFFTFNLLFILDTVSSILVTNLGIASIAPDNLRTAPEMFRLSIKAEAGDFPVETMMKTKAWSDLQNSVSAYAQRLELLASQNNKRSLLIALFLVVSASECLSSQD